MSDIGLSNGQRSLLVTPVNTLGAGIEVLLATSALQTTGNTSLSNIDTKLTKATSAPTTSVASSATSVQLLAANANRKWASFRNDSTQVVYVAKSATATTSSVYVLQPQGYLYFDDYTGVVTGIWVSANGFACIEEGV